VTPSLVALRRRAGTAHDPRAWMVPFGAVALVAVGVGALSVSASPPVLVLLAVCAAGWLVALDRRVSDPWLVALSLVAVGMAGAALDWLEGHGPAFVLGYMALAGLALRLPRRSALAAGVPLLAALSAAEAHNAADPGSAVLAVALGAGFLFAASSFAAVSRDARDQAERLLVEQAATVAAREQTAALAERARLARELHDVLAQTLSGLALQLEAARLLASGPDGDPRLAERLGHAHGLARDGMVNARRVVAALRGEALPGPVDLPRLVDDAVATTGVPVELEARGEPVALSPEAGLTLYRTVQEALTNVAKHAGAGACARVDVCWEAAQVRVRVVDRGGDGVGAGLPSGGFGLSGLAERAGLLGGSLQAGPEPGGFAVTLVLPAGAR
jgi:signal transduction histidine kinase